MPRFFTDPSNIDGSEIKITGSDVNHIKNVLRMRAGEEISVSDGAGKDYFGKIRSIDRDCVLIDIEKLMGFVCGTSGRNYFVSGTAKSG